MDYLSFIIADESVYFSHEHLQSPSTKEEILDLVKSAARNNQKIKVIGRGHSRSAIAQSDGVLISLHNFTGLVGVDVHKKRATVRTGTTLRTVNGYLDEFGLALGNLPAVADQTIGGAISIGLLRLLRTGILNLWDDDKILKQFWLFFLSYSCTICTWFY